MSPHRTRSTRRTADRHGCRKVIGLLTEYLEGDLAGRELEALETHLRGCGACAKYFETFKTTRAAVSTLRCAALPDELHTRLRAFLRLRAGATG